MHPKKKNNKENLVKGVGGEAARQKDINSLSEFNNRGGGGGVGGERGGGQETRLRRRRREKDKKKSREGKRNVNICRVAEVRKASVL